MTAIKTKVIRARITNDEQKQIRAYSKKKNLPVSVLIRQVVLDTINESKCSTGQETAKKQHNCALCEQD